MSGLTRTEGAALVMVLLVTVLLGIIATSLAFTVTLDGLAARNVQEASLAEGLAEGALELAADRVAEAVAEGLSYAGTLGPSDLGGIDAEVTASVQSGGYALTSVATVGRSTVRREAWLRYDAAGRPSVAARR